MTTLEELGRELVACERWRWMEGMHLQNSRSGPSGRVLEGGSDYVIWEGDGCTRDGGGRQEQCPPHPDIIPSIDDAATVGCLLAMLWEAWPTLRPGVRMGVIVDEYVVDCLGGVMIRAATPGEAIARALLQAWGTG